MRPGAQQQPLPSAEIGAAEESFVASKAIEQMREARTGALLRVKCLN
jgi:hypothetical protein